MMKRTPPVVAVAANSKSNTMKAAYLYAFFSVLILISAIVLATQVFAKPAPQEGSGSRRKSVEQPVELGNVHWLRDLDTAVSNSKKQNKPIAILFQEVPG